MSTKLSPPPYRDKDLTSQPWQKWFSSIPDVIANIVSSTSTILWSAVNKTNSNITDITTRNHNDLQNIQGGDGVSDFSHLKDTDRLSLTSGGNTTLHYHLSDRLASQGTQGPPGMDGQDAEDSGFYGVALRADATYVTPGYVGNSSNLDVAITNLDNSQTAQADTGFDSWTGAGNYYSIAANALTLLRGGVGYILGKKITWTAPQTAPTFTVGAAHYIYIDVNGVIGLATTRSPTLYKNSIQLFEVYYDGVNYEVLVENHPISFDTDAGTFLHENAGTILAPVFGTNFIGANINRITTGTGGAITDRQLKIVGTADINDQGLITNIPDSGGAAITFSFYYTDALGIWREDSIGTQFPMKYNNAGTMTALNTGGSNDAGIWTCYAAKAEPNSGLATYYAVAHNAAFNTVAQAQAVINGGTNVIVNGALFQALEPAQLGTVIVVNNVSGGYIATVNIQKDTLRSGTSGGAGATYAAGIATNTTNFAGNLSASDTNVQLALDTLDHAFRVGIPGVDGEDGESGMILLNPGITGLTHQQVLSRVSFRM